jgi:23S rRNA (pseudouridine1915-N3)-methyltransferase
MSKFVVLAPSSCSRKEMESLCLYFEKLAKAQVSFERRYFGEEKIRKDHPSDVEKALLKEAQRIEAQLKPDDLVFLMSEHGDTFSTEKLFKKFEGWLRSPGRVVFVFGSARGWHPSLKTKGRALLSLGPMTTQHELALVIWLEQLYRLTTLWSGKRYHY